jgi:uncharacterized membrane protein
MVSLSVRETNRIERLLILTAALAVIAGVTGVVYVSGQPSETTEPYTEFYALGSDGKAGNYPTNLTVGETGTITVGITNHEHGEERYTVVLEFGDRSVDSRRVTVRDGGTWEGRFEFTATPPGRHRLSMDLYRGTEPSGEPYRNLYIWVEVS